MPSKSDRTSHPHCQFIGIETKMSSFLWERHLAQLTAHKFQVYSQLYIIYIILNICDIYKYMIYMLYITLFIFIVYILLYIILCIYVIYDIFNIMYIYILCLSIYIKTAFSKKLTGIWTYSKWFYKGMG